MPASPTDARARTDAVRRVLVGILAANLAVVVVKTVVGVRSGSLGVLGSALDSAVDAANNILALIVTAVAAKAPDEEHPYGHGKFETLGALAMVGFLCVSSFELLHGAVRHLVGSAPAPAVTDEQIVVLTGTLAVNAAVAWYERRRGLELGSEILAADSDHTRADVVITLGVIGALFLTRRGLGWADPAIAILVVAAILAVACRILIRIVPVLVDERALPTGEIARVARSIAGVRQAYGIRSRGGTHVRYAEVTIAVDGGATVAEAHGIADQVEGRLRRELGLHEVTVHVEPC